MPNSPGVQPCRLVQGAFPQNIDEAPLHQVESRPVSDRATEEAPRRPRVSATKRQFETDPALLSDWGAAGATWQMHIRADRRQFPWHDLARRANNQRPKDLVRPVCQAIQEKIFCFTEYSGYPILPPVSSHQKGRIMIVANAGRDAVDADVPLTNGADADGKSVWSWHPDAGVKF